MIIFFLIYLFQLFSVAEFSISEEAEQGLYNPRKISVPDALNSRKYSRISIEGKIIEVRRKAYDTWRYPGWYDWFDYDTLRYSGWYDWSDYDT